MSNKGWLLGQAINLAHAEYVMYNQNLLNMISRGLDCELLKTDDLTRMIVKQYDYLKAVYDLDIDGLREAVNK